MPFKAGHHSEYFTPEELSLLQSIYDLSRERLNIPAGNTQLLDQLAKVVMVVFKKTPRDIDELVGNVVFNFYILHPKSDPDYKPPT